jgi:hypothetical protein
MLYPAELRDRETAHSIARAKVPLNRWLSGCDWVVGHQKTASTMPWFPAISLQKEKTHDIPCHPIRKSRNPMRKELRLRKIIEWSLTVSAYKGGLKR